jgi:hypothetical protein
MRQTEYRVISNFVIMSLAVCTLVLNVKSQGGIAANPSGPFSASIERRTAEQNLRSLPMRLRERRNETTHDPKLFERMNADFVRIQAIRNEMVREITAGKSFHLKRLEQDAAEIRKRAAKLKDSLALVDDQAGSLSISEPKRIPESSTNDAVFDLCLEISRFVENPIFKSTGVYTVRDAADASRALDTVIKLAAAIAESAGRLRKSN